jgi:hypothetical protein
MKTLCLTLPFSPGNFWPKTTRLSFPTYPIRLTCPPATFLWFSDWRLNWKAAILTQLRWPRQNHRRSWTPSQNTISRMNLKNGRRSGKSAHMRKGTTSRVTVGSKPKISLWPDGNISTGNDGYQQHFILFIFLNSILFAIWTAILYEAQNETESIG